MGMTFGDFCKVLELDQSDPDSFRFWLLSHCLPETSWRLAALKKIAGII